MEIQSSSRGTLVQRSYRIRHYAGKKDHRGEQLARSLGYFSLGLGAAELAAPNLVSRLVGTPKRGLLTRGMGAREAATGIGILLRPRPSGFLWGRVLGDLVDLTLLGLSFGAKRAKRNRLAVSAAAVAAIAALDLYSSLRLSAPRALQGAHTLAVNRSVEDCYRYWRDLRNAPRFMAHLATVDVAGPKDSHWVLKTPPGFSVHWNSEIIEDRPNELISWRSLEGSDIATFGSVRFSPGPNNRGTLVTVQIEYRPPFGRTGAALAKLLGHDPDLQIRSDLRRFKQLLEAGEIPTTRGQPTGRRSLFGRVVTKGAEL